MEMSYIQFHRKLYNIVSWSILDVNFPHVWRKWDTYEWDIRFLLEYVSSCGTHSEISGIVEFYWAELSSAVMYGHCIHTTPLLVDTDPAAHMHSSLSLCLPRPFPYFTRISFTGWPAPISIQPLSSPGLLILVCDRRDPLTHCIGWRDGWLVWTACVWLDWLDGDKWGVVRIGGCTLTFTFTRLLLLLSPNHHHPPTYIICMHIYGQVGCKSRRWTSKE